MSTSTRKDRTVQGTESVHPELLELGRGKVAPIAWATARIALGFVFAWAFVDKLFGLGYATPSERAWLNGGSPTTGYLGGVEGTFAGLFNAIAGQGWADWASCSASPASAPPRSPVWRCASPPPPASRCWS